MGNGISPIKGAKQFVAGVSGNPSGRPKLPSELRLARRQNMANLIRLTHQYIVLTDEQAKQRISGPDAQLIEEMIYGQIAKAKEGDSKCFQFIIEIMCGKIPESDEGGSIADDMTAEQKLSAAKMMVKVLEQEVNGSGST